MRGWLRQATGGLPRAFWLLWTGTLINRLGAFVVIFLAIYLTGERGFTQSQAGLVIGLYGAGGAVGTVVGGVLADRWGRRPTLLTAHFGAATQMVCLGFANDYAPIVATAFLLGVFAEGARPAYSAMMIDVVPEADRVRAYSLNYWAINLGFAIAAVSAGLAAEVDYLLLFLIDAGTTLVTGLITLCFLRETRPAALARTPVPGSSQHRPRQSPHRVAEESPHRRPEKSLHRRAGEAPHGRPGEAPHHRAGEAAHHRAGEAAHHRPGGAPHRRAEESPRRRPERDPGPRRAGLGAVFRDRIFIGFLLLNFGAVVVIFQHMSTLPIAMSADGLSPATFGWVIGLNGVLIVCGQLFVPRLIDGYPRSRVLALATVGVGVGFGLVAFADAAWLYAITVVIWTLGEMLQSPSNSALIAELSPTELRGRYQGVNSLSWSAGAALAPIAGGFVQEHLGDAALWLGCFGLAAAVALGQLVSAPSRDRRIAQLRAEETAAADAADALPTLPPSATGPVIQTPGEVSAGAGGLRRTRG